MSSSLLHTVVPAAIFFLPTFFVFSLLEVLIVELVEKLERHHGDRITAYLKSIEHHHHKILLAVELLGVALVGLSLYFLIPAIRSTAASAELSLFSVAVVLVITLLYFALTHTKTKFRIRKRGDRVLYLILSVLLYAFVLVAVHKKFPAYDNFINSRIVDPALGAVSKQADAAHQAELLEKFRLMILAGQCPQKDYRNEPPVQGVRHFVKVAENADLALPEAGEEDAESAAVHGRVCSDGQDTFLLTDRGVWYWVLVQQ